MNRTLKAVTVKRFYYEAHQQFQQHLTDFVNAYNFARRLKTLKDLPLRIHLLHLDKRTPKRFKLNSTHLSPGPNISAAE